MLATSSLRRTILAASVALACVAAPASASASAISDGTSNTIMFSASIARANPVATTRLMEEEGIGFGVAHRADHP